MSFKFTTFCLVWFLANAAYFHVFFAQFPRDEIRIAVPTIGIVGNVPITVLMLVGTVRSLTRARQMGVYYAALMFLVFLLVALYVVARHPTAPRLVCDDDDNFKNPGDCTRRSVRRTLLAFVNGLEMLLVYGGILFLEILRCQIITSRFQDMLCEQFEKQGLVPGAVRRWI